MATVTRIINIKAPPEDVFDLIERVEEFSNFSSHIKEVRPTGPGKYHWKVEFLGKRLEWDAVITEHKKPERFSWRSTRGIYNTGSYELVPKDRGTRVIFKMRYRFTGSVLETFLNPLLERVASQAAEDVLKRIKEKLEAKICAL